MSLSTHLRASGDHAVLPFDPACPVCRLERLSGTLPAGAVVGPRLTALAVAGVTAGCALTPAPVAIAQEPPIVLPPGGYEDAGEEALADEGPLVEDDPVESDEPDPNLPPPVLTDDPTGALEEPAPEQAPPATPPAPVPESAPPPEPAVAPPAPAKPAPEAKVRREPGPKRRADRPERAPRRAVPPAPRQAPATPERPAPVVATAPPVAAGAGYVVRPGDSLWSIAGERLGEHASPAAVATFVQAIWRANAAAIRTGDPDLLHPGTRIVLPGAPR